MNKDHYQEAFEKELDVWLDSDGHRFSCIGFNEGQLCCLEKYDGKSNYGKNGRAKLSELVTKHFLPKAHVQEVIIKMKLPAQSKKTFCDNCKKHVNQYAECRECFGYNRALSDLAHCLNIEI